MAAEISETLGLKPELCKGSSGVFDVAVDGSVIYSKDREGRYPDAAEIIGALRNRK